MLPIANGANGFPKKSSLPAFRALIRGVIKSSRNTKPWSKLDPEAQKPFNHPLDIACLK